MSFSIKKRCKFCDSLKIIKKGRRKTKQGTAQIYLCKSCFRRFAFSAFPAYSYPAGVILTAPLLYYLGYSLKDVRKRIQGKYKVLPSLSTVAKWINNFGKSAAIKKERNAIMQFDKPHRIIKRKLLKHKQNYLFQVHRYKMEHIKDTFDGLYGYLYDVLTGKVSITSDSFCMRASECRLGINFPHPRPGRNYACDIADIALKAALTNFQRHAVLQKFFLATDSATVAVEVPVYLTPQETKSILKKEGGLLGHIDFLQVFGDRITILDYKPKASAEKQVAEQLLLYSIALSRRTGVHLKKISCAWFNEKSCYSFTAIAAYACLKDGIEKNRNIR